MVEYNLIQDEMFLYKIKHDLMISELKKRVIYIVCVATKDKPTYLSKNIHQNYKDISNKLVNLSVQLMHFVIEHFYKLKTSKHII